MDSFSFFWLDFPRFMFVVLSQTDLPSLEWDGEFVHYSRLNKEIYKSSLEGNAVLWVVGLEGEGIFS